MYPILPTTGGKPYTQCNEQGAQLSIQPQPHLPVTLKALKLDEASDDDLFRVAEAALKEGESSPNLAYEFTPQQVVSAIKAADVHARAFMEKVGLSE